LLFNEFLVFHGVKAAGAWCCPTNAILVTTLKKEQSYTFVFNEFLEFHGVKAAGAWCCPTNTIFSDDVEETAEIYLCCSMSSLNFMGLKWPCSGALQLMPSLVTTLKKEQRYTFALQ
jgi:hypothetical protein